MKILRNKEGLSQFGVILKAMRIKQGLTQAKLAEKANITHSQISRIESGTIDPGFSQLIAISKALGIPLSRLLKGF
jgi:transcriptional regulator with XRE-family HTH domain